MSITVADALQAGRNKLAVKANDPEFTAAKLLESLNNAVGELHENLRGIRPDMLLVDATLEPDAPDTRIYTFATQTPAIGIVDAIRSVRLTDAKGALLTERPITHVDDYAGPSYAVRGLPGAQRIETSRDIPADRALFMRYVEGVPTLAANGTIPAWIPDRYVVLLGLKIAAQLFAQGGESTMPRDYAEQLEKDTDRLWDHWAFLSPSGLMRNDQDEGITPFLF